MLAELVFSSRDLPLKRRHRISEAAGKACSALMQMLLVLLIFSVISSATYHGMWLAEKMGWL